jgi:hypothetical protein
MERVGYFFRYQHFNAGGGGDYWKSKFTDIVRVSQLVLFCRAKVSVALPYYIIIYVYDHGTIGGVLSHIDVLVES